eukprot:1119043-Pelagomonas_calceolata.AAC.1
MRSNNTKAHDELHNTCDEVGEVEGESLELTKVDTDQLKVPHAVASFSFYTEVNYFTFVDKVHGQ